MENQLLSYILNFWAINKEEDKYYLRLNGEDVELLEVDEVIELMNNIEEKKFTIFYENEEESVAEVAVSIDFERNFRFEDERKPRIVEDNENKIKYEVDELSDNYIIWTYKKLSEKYPMESLRTENGRRIRLRLRHRAMNRIRREDRSNGIEIKEIKLLDIIRKAFFTYTLKVSKSKESKIDLEDAIESYNYTYMSNMNNSIKVYSFEEIIQISNRTERIINTEFEAPKRKYNSTLIDYYNLAVSSEEPFVSYISYYHIIEYFYDEVFREQQITTLRTSITSPRFSYKNDDQLFNVIEKILKDNRQVKENGSGNEQQSLNYVLNKYIDDIDDFKQRLSAEELTYYQTNIVSFSKGDAIIWDKDKDKVLKSISNRIYKNRNSLIHSKSSKKDVTYHPYLHKNLLGYEISLIKSIAECIIEKDSECL